MIIEFIGTPGSGKSTLISPLAKNLAEHNIIARTVVEASRPVVSRTPIGKGINNNTPPSLRRQLLWQAFYWWSYFSRRQFSQQHPALVSHVRETQEGRKISAEEREHTLSWWFNLCGNYQFLKPRMQSGEALILDEGYSHRVVQLNASDHEEINHDNLHKYLRLIPKPDMVIFIDTPAAVCEERVYIRGLWSRFENKTRQQVSQYILNSHLVVNLAVDFVKSLQWDVITVNNSAESISSAEIDLVAGVSKQLDNIERRAKSSQVIC